MAHTDDPPTTPDPGAPTSSPAPSSSPDVTMRTRSLAKVEKSIRHRTWVDAVVDLAALGAVITFVVLGKLDGMVGTVIVVAIAGVRVGALARSLPPPSGMMHSGAIMLVAAELLRVLNRGRVGVVLALLGGGASIVGGCFTPAGQFDGAQTLKVTRSVATNICRVIGALDTAAGVIVEGSEVRPYGAAPVSSGGTN